MKKAPKTLKIVFMGTPVFAVHALEALHADESGRFLLQLVVTRPDAVAKRGKSKVPSQVKTCAQKLDIDVMSVTRFDDETIARIAALNPDFIVVAAFGMILPPAVLDLPRYGCINIHGSILPRWRGAAPIQRAILAGDTHAGVSIMRMEAGLDTGPFCAVDCTTTAGKLAPDLIAELAKMGANKLLPSLINIADGTAVWQDQDESQVTYADKIAKAELAADPSKTALENVRQVCASTPGSPSRCVIAQRSVTLLQAQMLSGQALQVPAPQTLLQAQTPQDQTPQSQTPQPPTSQTPTSQTQALPTKTAQVGVEDFTAVNLPGSVIYVGKRLYLVAADGAFEVLRLKPDGKAEMDAAAFAAGLKQLQKGGSADWQSIETPSA